MKIAISAASETARTRLCCHTYYYTLVYSFDVPGVPDTYVEKRRTNNPQYLVI